MDLNPKLLVKVADPDRFVENLGQVVDDMTRPEGVSPIEFAAQKHGETVALGELRSQRAREEDGFELRWLDWLCLFCALLRYGLKVNQSAKYKAMAQALVDLLMDNSQTAGLVLRLFKQHEAQERVLKAQLMLDLAREHLRIADKNLEQYSQGG